MKSAAAKSAAVVLVPVGMLLSGCTGTETGKPSGQAANDAINKGADKAVDATSDPATTKLIVTGILVVIAVSLLAWLWRQPVIRYLLVALIIGFLAYSVGKGK